MTIWRAGMKAVCISPPIVKMVTCGQPQVGSVYTIRRILKDDEIVNDPVQGHRIIGGKSVIVFDEPAFFASRFRPLVSRPTSIAIFTEILDRVNCQPPEPEVPAVHCVSPEAS